MRAVQWEFRCTFTDFDLLPFEVNEKALLMAKECARIAGVTHDDLRFKLMEKKG